VTRLDSLFNQISHLPIKCFVDWASIGSRAGISGLHWHWRRHSDPTLPVDQSLINFTDPGALGSPQGLSAPRHVYRPLSAVLSPPPIPLLYRVEGLFQMRNHADGHVQRNPGTFRLPRRTQRARRSSISALCTCMKPRGITHGTDDRGIDIEDGQLGGTIALEKASERYRYRYLDLYHDPDP
jgi:hypothetical protein